MKIRFEGVELEKVVYPAIYYFRTEQVGVFRLAEGILAKIVSVGVQTGSVDPEDGFIALKFIGGMMDFEPGEMVIIAVALEQAEVRFPVGIARALGFKEIVERIRAAAAAKPAEATLELEPLEIGQ